MGNLSQKQSPKWRVALEKSKVSTNQMRLMLIGLEAKFEAINQQFRKAIEVREEELADNIPPLSLQERRAVSKREIKAKHPEYKFCGNFADGLVYFGQAINGEITDPDYIRAFIRSVDGYRSQLNEIPDGNRVKEHFKGLRTATGDFFSDLTEALKQKLAQAMEQPRFIARRF